MLRRLCLFSLLILLSGYITANAEDMGSVLKVDNSSKEIHVSVKSGEKVNIGDRLQVVTESGKIILEVTFPMMTVSKCKVKGAGKFSDIKKGMAVQRFSKDGHVKDDNTAVKPGQTKKFGNIEFVSIPSGTFMMGSPESENGRDDEEKQHSVTVSPFWIGKYEVTQKQYQEIMGTNPSDFEGDNLPVEHVNWEDAVEFCKKFSKKYNVKARLPYEAEWEYAARAGTKTVYYWGDAIDGDYLWYGSNSGGTTQPVGQKKSNQFGLYDMSGNVWEWCSDWYGEDYYSSSPAKDPTGPGSGSFRVLRGGSWIDDNGLILRTANRDGFGPGLRNSIVGFRVVVDR